MPFGHLRRREFFTLIASAAAAWPLAAHAQQSDRVRRVGVLMGGSDSDPQSQRYVAIFKDELAKLGWIEGRNLRVDVRLAVESGQSQATAAELVNLAPDVIYVSGGVTTRALRQKTQTIPIVFTGPSTALPT